MNEEMTIRDALAATLGILNGISVPVALMEQIGDPLRNAAENLGLIIAAIDMETGKTKEGEDHGAGDGV